MKRKVVFILGPTGSGKTSLAVKLAKQFNGEIISADSRQVYKGLDIGSGKDLSEYNGVKYHLIDICNPEGRFTLFDWLEQAKAKVEEIFKRDKLPIVVGGTGLYAKALYDGYTMKKPKPQNPKLEFQRDKLNEMSLNQLQKLIKKLEIDSKKLDMQNPRRLIRAIEKAQEGTKASKTKPNFESLILAIDLPRDELYQRIDLRVDVRFEKQKMLEEVRGLIDSGVNTNWLKNLGLEYKFITMHLLGELPYKEMVQELKWKTHAYARRQLTWLRKQQDLIWIKNQKDAILEVKNF